jgi:hypothetical protein
MNKQRTEILYGKCEQKVQRSYGLETCLVHCVDNSYYHPERLSSQGGVGETLKPRMVVKCAIIAILEVNSRRITVQGQSRQKTFIKSHFNGKSWAQLCASIIPVTVGNIK